MVDNKPDFVSPFADCDGEKEIVQEAATAVEKTETEEVDDTDDASKGAKENPMGRQPDEKPMEKPVSEQVAKAVDSVVTKSSASHAGSTGQKNVGEQITKILLEQVKYGKGLVVQKPEALFFCVLLVSCLFTNNYLLNIFYVNIFVFLFLRGACMHGPP